MTTNDLSNNGTYRRGFQRVLPAAFAVAILANILVAWTPHYWSATVGITGISLVAIAWAVSSPRIMLPRQTILAVAIGAWGPLQVIFNTSVLPSITLRSSLIWMMCCVSFILGSQILRSSHSRHAFLRIMLWAVTGLAVEAMLQASSLPVKVFGIIPADASVVGTIYYRNHFAALMEMVAPIALWEVRNGKVMAGGLCYAAMFAATVTSLSRTGTIVILTELLVFIAIMVLGRQLKLSSALAVAGALSLLVVAAAMVAGTEKLWERMQESNPYHQREQLVRSTVDMIAERPKLGFGMGTWRFVYPRFARYDDALIANEAHNDLAQWVSEGGIPFLLFMTGIVVWMGKRVFQSIWGLGLLAVFAHCYVDYALRFPPLQFLWFGIAGALTQLESRLRTSGVRENR